MPKGMDDEMRGDGEASKAFGGWKKELFKWPKRTFLPTMLKVGIT